MRMSSYLGIAFAVGILAAVVVVLMVDDTKGAATYFGVGLGIVAAVAAFAGILYFERREQS
jgi:hypothetical protein